MLPSNRQYTNNENERELIDFTFPDIANIDSTLLAGRVIVASTTKKCDEINEIATDLIPGEEFEKKSSDQLMEDSQQAKYPTEFLNSLSISGLSKKRFVL